METFAAPPRAHVVFSGDERTQLEAWLDFYRGTVLRKCDGLRPDQMKERPVTTSSLSLLGIVRHMTFVEQAWCESCFAGKDVVEYYRRENERDADFLDLESVAVEVAIELFLHSVATSRAVVAGHDLEEMAQKPRGGRAVDLRWIYLHLIEEYARHCGHADILRELVDGTVGY